MSSEGNCIETVSAHDGRFVQYKDWDMWKIKKCLVHHDFDTLSQVGSVVPVNGITNAGKSVTIACQHPSVSRVPSSVRRDYICKTSKPNVKIPKSRSKNDKHSWMSVSGNLTLYNQGGIWYADMPGLQDTRGKEEVLWTKACLNLFYSTVTSIPAVIVVINFSTHFYHDRGSTEQFNKLAMGLNDFFCGQKEICEAVVFVFTRPFAEGCLITDEDIQYRAEEYIRGQTEAIEQKENGLRMRFANNSEKASHRDETDLAYIKERRAGIFVMEMVLAAIHKQRVCISNPVDEETTELQRTQINAMINRAQSVPYSALKAIRTNAVGNSLEFCQILAALARDYNRILRKLVNTLENLKESAIYHNVALTQIQGNWEQVRDGKKQTTGIRIENWKHKPVNWRQRLKTFSLPELKSLLTANCTLIQRKAACFHGLGLVEAGLKINMIILKIFHGRN